MTCRHSWGDPNCSSYPRFLKEQEEKKKEEIKKQMSSYKILELVRFDNNVVLKVEYPSCNECSFEGIKILVFLDVTEKDILTWKYLDPHFKDNSNLKKGYSFSPDARFPNTVFGWDDALRFAQTTQRKRAAINASKPNIIKKKKTHKYWKINIPCWGTLWGIGTENQAERWRKHKSNWEGCEGTKTEVNVEDLPENKEWDNIKDLIS